MVLRGRVGRHPPKGGYCGPGGDPRSPQPSVTEAVVGMPPEQTSENNPSRQYLEHHEPLPIGKGVSIAQEGQSAQDDHLGDDLSSVRLGGTISSSPILSGPVASQLTRQTAGAAVVAGCGRPTRRPFGGLLLAPSCSPPTSASSVPAAKPHRRGQRAKPTIRRRSSSPSGLLARSCSVR
jgi:hypothetical protein